MPPCSVTKLEEPCFFKQSSRLLLYLFSHRIPKEPAIAPVLNQINSLYALPSYLFKIHFAVILSSVHVSSKWPVFHEVSVPKSCVHFSFSPCMVLALPVSSSVVSSCENYLMRNENHEAPCHAVSKLILLLV